MVNKNVAIKVENLSKCYRIGLKENMHDTFSKTLFNFIKSPLSNYRKYRSLYNFDDIIPEQNFDPNDDPSDIIWAIRSVSFEIKKGEIVGVIGVNGAGKSTLLKILTRITPPTGGLVKMHGKVSSLLEVGTGFHPELTGRENVYLNGTILGMRKKEIDRKFDEIVDFSGVEKFIDTPVKRYSSGMKVRLAFAVAAHLEPEILLIDEVLAVGDVSFQKKCLEKMEDVSQHGRTILFVSHNMQAISRLCPRSILLNGGRVQLDGPSHQVVHEYLNLERKVSTEREWPDLEKAPGDEVVRLCAVRVRTEEGKVIETVDVRQPVGIVMEYEVIQPGHVFIIRYHVFNEEGLKVFMTSDIDPLWKGKSRAVGRYVSTAWIPGNLLIEGVLFISPSITTLNPDIRRIKVKEAVAFQVIDSKSSDTEATTFVENRGGVVRPLLKWETQYIPNPNSLSFAQPGKSGQGDHGVLP